MMLSSGSPEALHEPSTFAAFADELAEPLLRQALAVVRDADLAQDVVQQTLIRAWECAGELPEHPAARRAWCSQTLLNFARMGLRSRKARINREKDVASRRAQRVDAEAHDPIKEVIAEEAWSLAMELEEPIREVLSLRFGMGMTLRETAEALEVPEGTVATRQRTGLEQLRRRLGLKPHAAASLVGAGSLLPLGEGLAHACHAEPAVLAQAKAGLLEGVAAATSTGSAGAGASAGATAAASTATATATLSGSGLAAWVGVPLFLLAAAALLVTHVVLEQSGTADTGAPNSDVTPSSPPEEAHEAEAPPQEPGRSDNEALIHYEAEPEDDAFESVVPVHCPQPCFDNEPEKHDAERREEKKEPLPGETCPEKLAEMLRAEPVRMPLPHSSAWGPHY